MKVLQIAKYNPSNFFGGIETVVKTINLAHKNNHDQIDSLVRGGSTLRPYIAISEPFFYVKRVWWLYKNINKYDLIYIHFPNLLALLPALLLVRNKRKLVCVYHSDITKWGTLGRAYQFINKVLLEFIETIICSSSNLIETSSSLNFYKEKCIVIPYTCISGESQATEKDFILVIARDGHYKGIDNLLSIINSSNFKVKVIGTKRESTSQVEFLGKVSDEKKWDLIKSSKFILLNSTSTSESYGIVIVEAFSQGKTVVVPDLKTGVNYLVGENERGLLFNINDKKSLLESLKLLNTDSDLREKLESSALEFYSQELSLETFQKRLIETVRQKVSI